MKLQAAGPLSQNHLGRLTAMDPNTAQGVILRLLRRRLVMRQPSPEDRRRKLLSLTEAGAALASRLKEEGRAISEATLAPLTARERRQLLALLARLV
jgi:DNA-binding MarR family transcriptional regulator